MFEAIKASLGLGPKPAGHFGWVSDFRSITLMS